MYIMRRTQLYLDDHLWGALRSRAQREKTTISELVRQAVRERYIGNLERRKAAMQSFVGIRKRIAMIGTQRWRFAVCVRAAGWTGSLNGDYPS